MATNIKISQMPKAENAKGIDLIPVVQGGINKTVTVNQMREGLATSSDLNNKVDKINGKGLSEKDFTTALYNKLNGIATNANNYTHPVGTAVSKASGFYKFSTDATSHISTAVPVSKSDITALGIPAQDTTYEVATPSKNGLLSSTDKTKLDSIAASANNYVHPSGSGNNHIPAGGNSGQYLVWSAAGTAVWGNAPSSTVYQATADALGGIKIGYTSSDKNYAVQLDDTGKAFVNVPWLNTTYTAATTQTLGLVKQGVAIEDASADDVTDKLNALLLSLRNAGIIAK